MRGRMDRHFEMLDRGDLDLVAVGRALLADPSWPAKVSFTELNPFSPETLKALV